MARAGGQRQRSIAGGIIVPAVGMLLALLVALGIAVWWRLSQESERVESLRASITAQQLAGSDTVSFAISPGDADALAGAARLVAATLARDPQVAYVGVTGQRGTLFSRFRDSDEGRAIQAGWPQLEALQEKLTPEAPRALSLDGADLVVAGADVAGGGFFPTDTKANEVGKPVGRVHVGISLHEARAARRVLLVSLFAVGVLAAIVYAGLMLLVVRGVSRRLGRVAERARRMQEGDLSARVDDRGDDELGAVGRAFDEATVRVGRIVARIGDVSSSLEGTAERIGTAAESVRGGAEAQRREADGSSRVADEVAAALAEIARRAEGAHGEARSGAAVAARISQLADAVSQRVEEAEVAVGQASDGVLAITRSIADVAGRAGEVSATAASTSSAILELNATIHRVRETAEQSAHLAERAGGDAERGQGALAGTLEGIERIRTASRAISDATSNLERRAHEIGLVLQLVGDLTERTNLLALNASIIAAQAGAEGRSFAVVAAEIKDLARRTAASAGEIAQLVRGVEEDAHAARRAAEVGVASVAEGADRARATAEALIEIFKRVRDSAQLSLSIATSTDEQVRASRYVADAMNQVTSAVDQIAHATADQTRQGEQLRTVAGRLRDLVRAVGEATREQRDGARQVATSVASLQGSVEQVAAAQRARAGDGARIRAALSAIRQVAAGHEGAVGALELAVGDLLGQARTLGAEVERLRT